MPKKDATKTAKVLMYLLAAAKDFEAVFPAAKDFVKDSTFASYSDFKNMVYHLQRRGLVKILAQGSDRVIKLTSAGELEALLSKARIPRKLRWDGKWRIVMFDFPESLKGKRDMLRRLLKKNGFINLQSSVFVSPHPLNAEAVEYIKQAGFSKHVRMFKVEEIDNDQELRKVFKLPVHL